ncbi:MAG: hypothetical protein JO342_08795 [Solirubrobacterales bacterium]|nr:hypothetical protein [Solirubrobacterales bacterium]
MAAATAVLLELSQPGRPVVLPSDGYPAVREVARDHLDRRGVPARLVATEQQAQKLRMIVEVAEEVWG